MLVWPYLVGFALVGLFVLACDRARAGSEWAQAATTTGVVIAVGLAAGVLALALILMLAGPVLSDGSALVLAARSALRQRYVALAGYTVAAAFLFELWGLLLEGGVSGRGPLAVLPALLGS